MTARYDSILDTVGNTPVVRLNNIGPAHVNLYAKVEAFNPMGSIKDRMAAAVIEGAERSGELRPGQTVVEATSGNTGIALAMVCAQKGYPLVITMAENFSVERRRLMRFLGAKVVLTPASEKGSGMVRKARELAAHHGWWQPRQFENPLNTEVHERTTAQEILRDFADVGLDYWVSGFGTGGTFGGVSRALRRFSPGTHIALCEPDNSPLVASGAVQKRDASGRPAESHPAFRPHLMQGWSPDFIPALAEDFTAAGRYDSAIAVAGDVALKCARDLACREGILAGISAGATLAGALEIAEQAPPGSNFLCMLPDTGERYLSTPLFEEVPAEMNAEELALSRSTSGSRFDPAPAPVEEEPLPAPEEAAATEVARRIEACAQPVTLFGLEWCEFCWSVKKVLKAYGVGFESVDLDARELQAGDFGSAMRLALRHRTGWNTFPQVFIGGKFVGGCTDLFDGLLDGSMFDCLARAGAEPDVSADIDPYSLLPGWLHPRG